MKRFTTLNPPTTMLPGQAQPTGFYPMKRWAMVSFIVASLLFPIVANGQLSGTFNIPVDYATIASAVADLNSQGVGGGGVIFEVDAGYSETISATISLTATGTVTDQIIFRKSGVGANPVITAYTGGTGTPGTAVQDGIWRLVGADYVTIDGIDLAENPANTTNPSTMEYGYALYKASATNGAQNNTIKNCTITLNRINNAAGTAPAVDGSRGIDVMNALPTAATTIVTVTDAAGTNSNNKFYNNTIQNCNIGIALIGFAAATPFTFADTGNDVGGASLATGNTIKNYGGGAATSPAAGIRTLVQYGINISFNTINNNDGGGANHATTLRGIFNNTATSASATISNNIITVKSGATTSALTAIENAAGATAAGNTISINNNTITNCTYTTATSGAFTGIVSSASAATVNINSNTLSGNATNATSGTTNLIQNTGAATVAININSNNINGWTFNAATSGTLNGINNTGGTTTTVLSINDNNFQSITHSVAGTNSHLYIVNTGTTLSRSYNNNTFTNLVINTTGSVTFFSDGISLSATGTETMSGNSIVTGFSKTGAGGTVTIRNTNASSATGSTMTWSNNNFSNITLTGATTFSGLINTDGGAPTKTITSNTINNLTGGTNAITGISSSFIGGTASSISSNTITNITGQGAITGITIGTSGSATTLTLSGNTITNLTSSGTGGAVTGLSFSNPSTTTNITGNTIRTLSSTGASSTVVGITIGGGATVNLSGNTVNTLSSSGATSPVVNGISVSSGTTVNVFKNKIYDLLQSGAITTTSPAVNGMLFSGGTTVNAYNNLVGDLRATAASLTDAIRGISVTSTSSSTTYNISFNSVYLAASSSGTNFGTTGVFHTTSATATTATLNLRSNIIVNASVPAGTGLAVAYRRSSTALTNYGSASNNNMFYAGTPGASNLIFSDGTNLLQTLAAYKALSGLTPRDQQSVSENPPFLSTTGSSANFLHINTAIATQAESGGVTVAGVADDYDGDTRNVSTPDIGADEGSFTLADMSGPSIVYTALGNNTSTTTSGFANVVITDATGVEGMAGIRPRVYYKRSTDANAFNDNTNATDGWKFAEANGSSSPFDFTIDYSLIMGGVAPGNIVQYFVVAQDIVGTPNVSINAGTFAAPPASVALTAAEFPIGGTPNSYVISTAYNGAYNVGVGETYETLTTAGGFFAALNAGVATGNITVNITSDLTEDGTNALNQMAEEGMGGYTLTIQSGAPTERLISTAFAGGMIRLNGADRVTFDGRVSESGMYLRFRNTSTSGQAFVFLNDATNNTIRSCFVEGANTSTTSGTIVFGTSTGTLGNSNNTIVECDIRDRSDAAGVPANAIYSSGTSTALNGSNTISGCNVFNWTNSGVLVSSTGAGNGWTINPSSFYQTAPRSAALVAISILGGSGHSVLNNAIGGSQPNAGGSFLATSSTFRGINLTVGTTSATSVQGNTIKNIRSTATGFTSSYGIILNSGFANIGNITGNTIGSSDPNERFEINGDSYGINVASSSNINVSNNTIDNFGTNATPSTGQYYFGIQASGTGAHTVMNNTVTNLTNASVPDASFNTQTIGINITATGVQTVIGNTVSNTGNTSAIANPSTGFNNRIWGIIISGTAVGTAVEKNRIFNLYGTSPTTGARADVVSGLQAQSTANGTFSNNMVSLDGGSASDRVLLGIAELSTSPAVANYYYNSVSISGTASTANATAAFLKSSTSTVNVKNNIFSNSRTGGTGLHFAVSNASATGWPATASDFNDLYSANPAATGQWIASVVTFTGWQAAQPGGSGGDANSKSVAPVFVAANDLHLVTGANPLLDGAATPIGGITTDFDGDTRDGSTPDIGADEFTPPPCVPPVVSAPTITQPTCAAPTGTIVVNATGSSTLEYSINNGTSYQASATFSGLAPGSYFIKAREVSNQVCMAAFGSNPVAISALPSAPTVNAPTVTQPTCGTPSGTIVVNATGAGTLEYSIDNGANWQISPTFSGLTPGNYDIAVRLQGDPTCTTMYGSNPVAIDAVPSAPMVSTPTLTQPTCSIPSGTIVVNATGAGTLEYSIDNGANWQASATFGSLTPGNYDIAVRLQSDPTCTTAYGSNPVAIDAVPSAPMVGIPTVTQPTCGTPSGTIVVSATGAGTLEYSIDNGATWQVSATFSGLTPGNYNIAVRLQSDPTCTMVYDNNPVAINTAPSAPAVSAPTLTQPTCAVSTGTIIVNATGAGTLEYSIDNGTTWQTSATFGSLTPGNYDIAVRLQSDPTCTTIYGSNPVAIDAVPSAPMVSAPTLTQPTCGTPTGTIVVNATGAGTLEYSIDNGTTWQVSATFPGLTPGNYNIAVRLQNDPTCTTTYGSNPVVLNTPVAPTISSVLVAQPTCGSPTGTIAINAAGGGTLEYSVNNGMSYQASPIFTSMLPGSYDILVRQVSDPACVTVYSGNPVVLNVPMDCCPPTLAVNLNPIPNDTYQASMTITSNGLVPYGGNVVFGAFDAVELQPGFEVAPGGTLTVVLAGCTP
ncbi:MAG: hypothetical protein H6577_27965 [Lewinellaceae bacterium]|nr:hypothetical protein [Lewinellaceae bacterium]